MGSEAGIAPRRPPPPTGRADLRHPAVLACSEDRALRPHPPKGSRPTQGTSRSPRPVTALRRGWARLPPTVQRASFGRSSPAFSGPLRPTRSPSLTPHYREPHRYYDSICRPGPLGSPLSARLPPPSLGPSPSRTSPRGLLPRPGTDRPRVSQGHHGGPMPSCPPHSRLYRSPRTASPPIDRVALPWRRWTRFARARAGRLALGALRIPVLGNRPPDVSP